MDFGKGKEVRRCGKLWNLEKKISKWTGLFSVNGLGLNFCGIFEEKSYRSAFGKIGSSQNKGKKENCLANFGIFAAEKTWKRRIEASGIGEI